MTAVLILTFCKTLFSDENNPAETPTEAEIAASNQWLGSQVPTFGGFYTAGAGLELDSGDSFTISPNRRTLTVTFDTSDGMDQLRVVTVRRLLNEWCP